MSNYDETYGVIDEVIMRKFRAFLSETRNSVNMLSILHVYPVNTLQVACCLL